jgi:hypothetical protein
LKLFNYRGHRGHIAIRTSYGKEVNPEPSKQIPQAVAFSLAFRT